MSEHLLTKCTHCHTVFRVSEEQLKVAGGAVRCGACYQVFKAEVKSVQPDASSFGMFPSIANGESHSTPTSPSTEPPIQGIESARGAAASVPGLSRRSRPLTDEDWAEELLRNEGVTSDEPNDLINDNPEQDQAFQSNTAFSNIISDDSSFIEPTAAELKNKQRGILGSSDFNDSFRELSIDSFETAESSTHNEDEWAKSILNELESEPSSSKPKPELTLESQEPSAQQVHSKKIDMEAIGRDFDADVERQQLQQQHQAANAFEAVDLNNKGITSPIIIPTDTPKSSPATNTPEQAKQRRVAVIVALNIAAVTALVLQYAYFNRHTLALNDRFRPYYDFFCAPFDCNLPSRVDLDSIETKLVLRPHKEVSNALTMDALLYNRAKFEQPYPDLMLSFEDINGKPLASRRFTPHEYFKKAGADLQKMPINTPVRVTLQLDNPGDDAVNYQMQILPQSPPSKAQN